MSEFEPYVRWKLDYLQADADLPYEAFVERRFSRPALEREARATAPARAREAVARYLPEATEGSRFARGMAAYARCEADGCRDRAAGEPECRDSCRRAKAALRRGS